MKNFAYGYTDREIGPGRPTPARPAPPLLYHKPQALSIGILHKKNSGRKICPKILIIICVIIIFIPHRCEIIAIVEWVFQRAHTRLRIICVVRTIPTIYRAMVMFHFSSSSGSSLYSQGRASWGQHGRFPSPRSHSSSSTDIQHTAFTSSTFTTFLYCFAMLSAWRRVLRKKQLTCFPPSQ